MKEASPERLGRPLLARKGGARSISRRDDAGPEARFERLDLGEPRARDPDDERLLAVSARADHAHDADDALAKRGVRFTQFYVTSAVCSPSFVICRQYTDHAPLGLFHVDAFRLSGPQDLDGPEGQPIPVDGEVQGMPENQVVRVVLGQPFAQGREALTTVPGAVDDDLPLCRVALLILDRGDEPRGLYTRSIGSSDPERAADSVV